MCKIDVFFNLLYFRAWIIQTKYKEMMTMEGYGMPLLPYSIVYLECLAKILYVMSHGQYKACSYLYVMSNLVNDGYNDILLYADSSLHPVL